MKISFIITKMLKKFDNNKMRWFAKSKTLKGEKYLKIF